MTSKVVSYKDLFSEFISASDLQESKLVELLHEEIGSDLMALKLKLSATDMMDEVKSEMDEKINGLLNKIKNLTNQFYPTTLDELGLIAALKTYARKCEQLKEIQVNFNYEGKSKLVLSIERQKQLYYIVEEILFKIIDNSTKNDITIEIIQYDKKAELTISDSERFSETILTNELFLTDLGIQKMHSRLALIKGDISCREHENRPTIKITISNE